jgi:hypothetical protein
LQLHGYTYDVQLQMAGDVFGFCKSLGCGRAIIQFQRRKLQPADSFTVNLIYTPDRDIQPHLSSPNGARAARLSTVLWYVSQARRYPTFDFWWSARNEQERSAALSDALDAIEQYGLPWLENPAAARPWEMPLQRSAEFFEAVQANLLSELRPLGYEWQCQSLSGATAYCYFDKRLPDGSYALIEFQPIYSLDPDRFTFDVRLQRRGDANPLTFSGDYADWRSASLAQLLAQTRSCQLLEQLALEDVKALLWHYADRAALDVQLQDAARQIKRLGLAWVEQSLWPLK